MRTVVVRDETEAAAFEMLRRVSGRLLARSGRGGSVRGSWLPEAQRLRDPQSVDVGHHDFSSGASSGTIEPVRRVRNLSRCLYIDSR